MYISTSKKYANANCARVKDLTKYYTEKSGRKSREHPDAVRERLDSSLQWHWRNFKPPGENTGQQDTQNFLTRLWILYANSFLNDKEEVSWGAKEGWRRRRRKKDMIVRWKEWNREKRKKRKRWNIQVVLDDTVCNYTRMCISNIY